jgi:transcriptional regulator with GAF, ATPase, and Fis domain
MSDHEARSREFSSLDARVINTFVTLADTLVDEYDVIDFLGLLTERCVELLPADEAGILLADEEGHLHAVAASSERTHLVELYELQSAEGPCLDAYRTGEQVLVGNLAEQQHRWPTFAVRARDAGFSAVYSLPMRLRMDVIGALNLLRNDNGTLSSSDLLLARALADIATIGLLHQRALNEWRSTATELQHALTSRVSIEQAKGVLAARHDLSIDAAFELLRSSARRQRLPLTNLAHAVVHDRLELDLGDTPGH